MISDKDISIVVQGPILTHSKYNLKANTTQLVCLRLKELFPQSELILSTWEGENVDNIPYDKLIFNKDPGATWFNYNEPKLYNNCNRMITSTLSGIQSASRKYILKVRSDLFIVSKNFLNYFDRYALYNDEYKFVKSRIIAFSMWSIQGHKTCHFTMPKPFHISDWAYFGFKEDLMSLYDVPLIEEPDFSQWFLTRCKSFHDIAPEVLWKMPPEQHITSSFFKKYIPLQFEHTADDSHENMKISSQLIMNNFLILDQTQFFLISLKHFCFQFSRANYEWFIYHNTWLKNYHLFITKHHFLAKLKYKIFASIRNVGLFFLYKVLFFLNKYTQFINRSTAYLIKRWSNKIKNLI
ncbi:WavE lipopolysaccharide synthesis family protein [Legionella sainthelensi]|uniref:WavE lipopolysaccharide synthesis n=1 Tax=Legionella sainthelensi TaxID=28087 RepID=A0A2H5FRT6_9GAMM|nr:WavE lipopolysaccharide synthesis family protein [Legionella sainthelensi]AUH74278.1 hypothetical protein CAB17_20295 [Legionella sainthelensi]